MKFPIHKNALKYLQFGTVALITLCILLSSCNTNERVRNSEALASEIKASKIRRITGAELDEMLQSTGEKVAGFANKSLETDTLSLANCATSGAKPFFDILKKKTGTDLALVFTKDTAASYLTAKEKDLLKAYHFEAAIGNELPSEIQKLNDTLSVYYSAVPKSSALFRNCDEAKTSSFALWRIVLNQKQVIRNRE